MRSSSLLDQIEADIAEAERLIAELRFKITVAQSSDEDTTEMQVRLQQMLRVLLVLQDQRVEAGGAKPIIIGSDRPRVARSSTDRQASTCQLSGASQPHTGLTAVRDPDDSAKLGDS